VGFGLWRENEKRPFAAVLAIALFMLGFCLVASPLKRSTGVFRQNNWHSFFNAMKVTGGSAAEGEILGSRVRNQISPALRLFAGAFAGTGILGMGFSDFHAPGVCDNMHGVPVNGADMVSRE
jgi:hypothetical protein